jgi:hypothetical protein
VKKDHGRQVACLPSDRLTRAELVAACIAITNAVLTSVPFLLKFLVCERLVSH